MNVLPSFRRSLGYVWPQRRLLGLAVLMVLGVSFFYTVTITSVLPLLKVMFAQYETLTDWVYRCDVEHRLGVGIPADVQDLSVAAKEPLEQTDQYVGISLFSVKSDEPLGKQGVRAGDKIVEVRGTRGGHYQLLRAVSALPDGTVAVLHVLGPDDQEREVSATPLPSERSVHFLLAISKILPQGRQASDKFRTLVFVVCGLILAAILGGICRFVHEYTLGIMSQRALLNMRSDVFAHILRLPMTWFSQQQAGDTMSRFARDSSVVDVGYRTLFGKTIAEPLKASFVFVASLLIEPTLILAVLLTMPAAALVMYVLGGKIKRAQRRALEAWGQVLDLLDEKIAGIKVVKSYHAEDREGDYFVSRARVLLRQHVKIAKADAATSPLLEVLGAAAVGGFVLWGGWQIFDGRIEAETFFTAVAFMGAMFAPIRRVANVNNRIQAAESASVRIFEVLDLQPEVYEAADAVVLPPLQDEIEFRGVGFTYPNAEQPALQQIDLRVPAGQTLAIVGPNGSGKTTLCSLLLRFFEPQEGQVLFDGVDLRTATLASLRRQIGLVTQDTIIFTDTVRDNLAYAKPDASDEQIIGAAKAAHADEFIREIRSDVNGQTLAGYDAIINARTLSGGEKQRLAIARAVLHNPAIMIFDEATSQVDAESEQKIQEALAALTHGRTTFIIAHRLSTVVNASRIAVMDKGRIVATGTHQQLLETCPEYRVFCDTQLQPAG